jgi:hypothetical protein
LKAEQTGESTRQVTTTKKVISTQLVQEGDEESMPRKKKKAKDDNLFATGALNKMLGTGNI